MSDDDQARAPDDIAREGAAAAGADSESEMGRLPRILRYAFLMRNEETTGRILAEIVEVAPDVSAGAALWVERREEWHVLASILDRQAVERDLPVLRALADSVRMTSLTIKEVKTRSADALRVVAAFKACLTEAAFVTPKVSLSRLAQVEEIIIGWTDLIAGDGDRSSSVSELAQEHSRAIGSSNSRYIRSDNEERVLKRAHKPEPEAKGTPPAQEPVGTEVPADHVLVCPILATKSDPKTRDNIRGHEHVVGVAQPLAPMPDVASMRQQLLREFPYAAHAIDSLIGPLFGRAFVRFPPLLLLGPPGAGKSRLARRFAEELGVGLWRVDGGCVDGGTFGGTDRRWHSTQPSHPFLAISRTRMANPVILVDEVDKSASRTDFGRLWDNLLPFLERETALRYQDPCLQVPLDLSYVGFVATANSLAPLPPPLVDRFRVVEMQEPQASDLPLLVAPLVADYAHEQGLDERWYGQLTHEEMGLLATRWHGGSIRRLRAYVSVVLRARDRSTTRS